MWDFETTEGQDPISTTAYKFGRRSQSFGDLPNAKFNLKSTYRGSRDPIIQIADKVATSSIAFNPVCGIPWYLLFGSSSTTTGVHTISGIDYGALPTITQRYQTENNTENIRKSMVGSKVRNLNFTVQNIGERLRMPAVMGIGSQGIDIVDPTATGDITPTFPGSNSDPYYIDNNFELTWDYGVDNVDYAGDIMEFKYICDTTNRFLPIVGNLTPLTVAEGSRVHILIMDILRGNDTSIFDDYLAQTRSSTGKDLRFKIHQSSTNYLQLDFSNVFIENIPLNDPTKDEHTKYTITAFAENCTPKIKDGLDETVFYGE